MKYKQKIIDFVRKRRIILIICTIVLLFILPWFLDLLIFGNSVPSALTNGEWASFLGSYLGGVLGGLCTLVAVVVTVRINQKQILNAEKEKIEAQEERLREDRKKRKAEILSHTLDFISDIERWIDKETCDKERMRPYQGKRYDFEHVKKLYHQDLTDRYGGDWFSFFELPEIKSQGGQRYKRIATNYKLDYEARFSDQQYSYRESLSYNNFGSYLDGEIEKYRKEEDTIQQEIDEERQKRVIGNPHYLYLEVMLKDSEYADLWKHINELYDTINPSKSIIFFNLNFELKVKDAINAVKESLRKLLN